MAFVPEASWVQQLGGWIVAVVKFSVIGKPEYTPQDVVALAAAGAE
jgi:hypothetical protein